MHFLVLKDHKPAFFCVLWNFCVLFISLVPFFDIVVVLKLHKNQLETPSHGSPCLISLCSSPNTPRPKVDFSRFLKQF